MGIRGLHVQGAILGVRFLLSRGFRWSFWACKHVDAGNCCFLFFFFWRSFHLEIDVNKFLTLLDPSQMNMSFPYRFEVLKLFKSICIAHQ